ncbi:hypothetical protein BJF78_22785 [Pseudonocardia sp. CNS-139]|nr:hypothetical protein BJF78_22785 [Pseudonocardia sp. CNS-139]
MVRYEYRCPTSGPWDVAIPMGAAEAMRPCPHCGQMSPRRWTAPLLLRANRRLTGARLREEASRDAPEVTAAVPAGVRRSRPAPDPRQAGLPRP